MRAWWISLAAVGAALIGASGAQAAPPFCGPSERPCTRVVVPLDHFGGAPGSLRLQVEIQRARKPTLPPLLLLAGGPGQSATSVYDADAIRQTLGKAVEKRDVVVFDQRGTGLSGSPALQGAGHQPRCPWQGGRRLRAPARAPAAVLHHTGLGRGHRGGQARARGTEDRPARHLLRDQGGARLRAALPVAGGAPGARLRGRRRRAHRLLHRVDGCRPAGDPGALRRHLPPLHPRSRGRPRPAGGPGGPPPAQGPGGGPARAPSRRAAEELRPAGASAVGRCRRALPDRASRRGAFRARRRSGADPASAPAGEGLLRGKREAAPVQQRAVRHHVVRGGAPALGPYGALRGSPSPGGGVPGRSARVGLRAVHPFHRAGQRHARVLRALALRRHRARAGTGAVARRARSRAGRRGGHAHAAGERPGGGRGIPAVGAARGRGHRPRRDRGGPHGMRPARRRALPVGRAFRSLSRAP